MRAAAAGSVLVPGLYICDKGSTLRSPWAVTPLQVNGMCMHAHEVGRNGALAALVLVLVASMLVLRAA